MNLPNKSDPDTIMGLLGLGSGARAPRAPASVDRSSNRDSSHEAGFLRAMNVVLQDPSLVTGLSPFLVGPTAAIVSGKPTKMHSVGGVIQGSTAAAVPHGRSSHQSTSKKSRDKLHKKSRSKSSSSIPKQRRGTVPCMARRMPPDHNFETAVFVLHKGMRHGEQLICSYPQCRDEGIKFCYCELCGIPVAKRNFKSRHDHSRQELEQAARKTSAKRPSQSQSDPKSNKRAKTFPTEMLTGGAGGPKTNSSGANVVEPGPREAQKQKKQSNTKEDMLTDEKRFSYWNWLLEIRPTLSDGRVLGKWVDTVMLVSTKKVSEGDVSRSCKKLVAAMKELETRRREDEESSDEGGSSMSEFSSVLSASSTAD